MIHLVLASLAKECLVFTEIADGVKNRREGRREEGLIQAEAECDHQVVNRRTMTIQNILMWNLIPPLILARIASNLAERASKETQYTVKIQTLTVIKIKHVIADRVLTRL